MILNRAYLAGYFLGDGTWINQNPWNPHLMFCGAEPDRERVSSALAEEGIQPKVIWRGKVWTCTLPVKHHGILTDLGMTPDKLIPLENRTREFLALYLSGYWDADGWVARNARKGRVGVAKQVASNSSSKVVSDQIVQVCDMLGVEIRRYRREEPGNGAWIVSLPVKAYGRFISLVSLQPKKQLVLDTILA